MGKGKRGMDTMAMVNEIRRQLSIITMYSPSEDNYSSRRWASESNLLTLCVHCDTSDYFMASWDQGK